MGATIVARPALAMGVQLNGKREPNPPDYCGSHFLVVTGFCNGAGGYVSVNDPLSYYQPRGPGNYNASSFETAFGAKGYQGLAVGSSFGTFFPDVVEIPDSGRRSWVVVRNGSLSGGTQLSLRYYQGCCKVGSLSS